MYQYMYVSLHTGGGALVDNVCCKHRELITQYAAQGWRYVGFVPTQFTRTGGIKDMDLVFEKPEAEA